MQPGLSGVNLGKFLIKRVVDVVKKDMPNVSVSYGIFIKWSGFLSDYYVNFHCVLELKCWEADVFVELFKLLLPILSSWGASSKPCKGNTILVELLI